MVSMSGTHARSQAAVATRPRAAWWRLPWIWRERRELRRELARMDAHLWADLGFDEATAQDEMAKPFWVP